MITTQTGPEGCTIYFLNADETLTDLIGSPGDMAYQITGAGLLAYGAKGAPAPTKPVGVWPAAASSGAVASVAGKTGVVTLVPGDVGLGNVDNTSNATERAAAVTLTNKRVTKRVLATAGPGATPTINTDSYDVVNLTALAAAITSMTTNLTGTPVAGDTLRIALTDNGTARAITWGASFESSTYASLPGTTVISTRMDVAFVWNTATSKWRCVGVA